MVLDRSGERAVLWVHTDVPEAIVRRVLDAVQAEQ
jgi:hypothetical protein